MTQIKGPFAEKEDQIIILCLKKATSPNISDVVREAAVLLNRSFSSVYQRYLNLGKPTLKSIKQKEQDFEDYKLIHQFFFEEPLKGWINMLNYLNRFKNDWEILIDVIDKIEKLGYSVRIDTGNTIIYEKVEIFDTYNIAVFADIKDKTKIINTYQACIVFIKYYNTLKH